MSAALRPFLLVAGHGDQLTRVLLRAAHVDQLGVLVKRVEHLVAESADVAVGVLRLELGGL